MLKRILLCVIILAVTINVSAEDEQKNNIYVISDFSKGLNTKTSEFSLPRNQGDQCQNIRFSDELGSITKRNILNLYGTADATNPILGMHRLYLSDGTKVLLVNVDDKIYKTDNDSLCGFVSDFLDEKYGDIFKWFRFWKLP